MRGFILLVFLFPALAFAREAVIDPYQYQRDQGFSDALLSCEDQTGTENVFVAFKCKGEVRKKYKTDVPKRGSDEYAAQHYSGLTKAQGEEKIKELQAMQQKARENVRREDLQPGEVVAEDFLAEKWWIMEHVLGLDPQRTYIRYN